MNERRAFLGRDQLPPLFAVAAIVLAATGFLEILPARISMVSLAQTSSYLYLPQVSKGCSCYYVDSVEGDDANSGKSELYPWKSLWKVTTASLPPGTSVLFRRGRSWVGELVIDQSGSAGLPITFAPYGEGQSPSFSNPGARGSLTRAIVVGGDWTIIEGLVVQDVDDAAIKLMSTAENNIVRDTEITNAGIGVQVDGNFNALSRLYIHDLHMVVDSLAANDDYGAVGVVLASAKNNEVSFSRFERCRAPSTDYGQDGGAVEWYGNGTDGNYVHHNWASDSDGFLEMGGGSMANSIVAYNVSVDNGRFLLLNLDGIYKATIEGMRVENNTIVEAAMGVRGWAVLGFSSTPDPNMLSVRNNIFQVDNYRFVANLSGFEHNNNLYYLPNGTAVGYALGVDEVLASPSFLDGANRNFHLGNNSRAIDAGLSLGYKYDFDLRTVPAGLAPDLGAFESAITP